MSPDQAPKKTQEIEKKRLSDMEIQNLFFLSFQFSQGNPNLQKWILEQARAYYGPQKISKTRMDKLIENFTKSQTDHESIISPQRLQSANLHNLISIEVAENYDNLKNYLNRLVHAPNSDINPIVSILDRDIKYLTGRRSRLLDIDPGGPFKSKY
jgi:hypothetical protein